MIKQFEDFLKSMNENSSSWYPTFKAQGECINKKDAVTLEELNKIAYYFKEFYKMSDIQVGEIDKEPDKSSYTKGETEKSFGVIGQRNDWFSPISFCYYWKQSSDPELEDIESGWVGRAYMKNKAPGQFMSPFQFLECVEMDYFYSNSWIEPTKDEHLSEMKKEMEKLALQSPRRGKITGGKYGL
jgi:hypothetical protein